MQSRMSFAPERWYVHLRWTPSSSFTPFPPSLSCALKRKQTATHFFFLRERCVVPGSTTTMYLYITFLPPLGDACWTGGASSSVVLFLPVVVCEELVALHEKDTSGYSTLTVRIRLLHSLGHGFASAWSPLPTTCLPVIFTTLTQGCPSFFL